ncbi:hypothetical protein [Mucilaginibacter jinjuensis]|uniref:Secreted protein n=1 Tax=Mucilaginibacter jinjuensis TaxID=1176721 RepID=A0ABY7TBE4_9SPHI|nr:hypothetical protein [Mucilaginibacter jinjuensis]WCT13549.1 hypothetical protein PQO05_06315 [Mucilaginibacter jinjuensis]
MKYKFLKLLFLFSIILSTQIKSDDDRLCNFVFTKHSHSTYLGTAKGNRSPYIYFLGLNGTFQIYRAQTQRGGNFIKSLLLGTFWFCTGFKSLSVSFLRTGAGHISSRKLILFPFHDFW